MPSIIDKQVQRNESVPGGSVSFERGIEILRELIGHVRRPRTWDEERLALEAINKLRGISGNADAHPPTVAILIEEMSMVNRDQVSELVNWLHPRPLRDRRISGRSRRAGLRHLLLIILLAKRIAPVFKFPIAQELSALGFWPEKEDSHLLLNWLPRRFATKEKHRVGGLYIDAVIDVWFTPTHRPDSANVEQIASQVVHWSVLRQMLELLAWHREWRRLNQESSLTSKQALPTKSISSVEFQLSRNRHFGKLSAQLGPIESRLIVETGYRDRARVKSRRAPWGYVLAATALLSGSVLSVLIQERRVQEWHHENLQRLQEYRSRLLSDMQAFRSYTGEHGPEFENDSRTSAIE